MSAGLLERASVAIAGADLARRHGRVSNLIGLIIEATGVQAEVGEVCMIGADRATAARAGGRGGRASDRRAPVPAEVVGFREGRTLLMGLGELQGIGPGTQVRATGAPFRVAAGEHLLGRVVDGLGVALDDTGSAARARESAPEDSGAEDPFARDAITTRSTVAAPPAAMTRPRIVERVGLGVRALDGLVPCGRGQRLGIFAGSGVGKSSLLGMIARSTSASVNVIALVGERGREVREFIERDLGDALSRSVVVVATSDQPALVRIKAAFVATTIAEHFRDAGHDVLLMMDSVTRFAMAQREVGLAIGEPPATRGYTPSVFALLPRLLERAGTSPEGSITGLYTVLVDGDDMNEPIADAVRSILDGHIVLARALAHAGHYPAIDVLQSVSRLVGEIVPHEVAQAGQRLRAALASLREKEDLIAIGAYQPGADPALDAALAHRTQIDAFLRQPVEQASDVAGADAQLLDLASSLERHQLDRDQIQAGEIVDAEELVDGVAEQHLSPVPVPPPAEPGPAAIPAVHLDL